MKLYTLLLLSLISFPAFAKKITGPVCTTQYRSNLLEDSKFSVEVVAEAARDSELYWKNGATQEDKDNLFNDGIDDGLIADMNIAAADIWNSLLACNSNDLTESLENYFMGKPCPLSETANNEVKRKLAELGGNITDLAASSRLLLKKIEGHGSVSHIHPLLAQMTIQMQMLITHSPDEKASRGGWFAEHLARYIVQEALTESKDNFTTRTLQAYEASEIAAVTKNLNIYILMTKFIKDDCSAIGLYPRLNRSLLQFFEKASIAVYNGSGSLSKLGESFSTNVIKACGPQDLKHQDFVILHLMETRRLTATYYPAMLESKKAQRNFSRLTAKTGFMPVQKLLCDQK